MYSFLIDSKAGLEKYWFAYTILADSQPQQNLRWKLGLANNILCCWVIFRLLITVAVEIGLVIHHTFVVQFCIVKVLRQEVQHRFEDGLLTCCGFGIF
jgi:hypothetical protein